MQKDESRRDAWRSAHAKQILETARAELKSLGFACCLEIDQPEPNSELGIVLRCASSAESLELALAHASIGNQYTNSGPGIEQVRQELSGRVTGSAITITELQSMSEEQQHAIWARDHVGPRRSTYRVPLSTMTRNYQNQRLVLTGDQLLPSEDEMDDGSKPRRLWLGIESKESGGTWLHEAEILLYEVELARFLECLQQAQAWLVDSSLPPMIEPN